MIFRTLFIFILVATSLQAQSNFEIKGVDSKVPQTKEVRQSSSDLLQKTLYELIDHYHALQQLHWNTKGPHFITIHELTEDFYKEFAEQIDLVAERKLALGYPADGNPDQISSKTGLKPYSADYSKDHESVEFLINRYAELSKRIGQRIKNTPEDDMVTEDVFIGLRDVIDHHLYLIRSFSY